MSTLPKYKLYYYDWKSRGEPIRIVFAYAGVEYEDCRISFENRHQEWFPLMKNSGKFPFRQIPILAVNGATLAQTRAIMRYLARQFDIGPKDSLLLAKADMIMEKVQELENSFCNVEFYDVYYEKNINRKEQLRRKFEEETLPQALEDLEKLGASNRGNVWFAGEKLSTADIDFFAFMNTYRAGGRQEVPSELHPYPHLLSVYRGVMNEPRILDWIKKRPQTEW